MLPQLVIKKLTLSAAFSSKVFHLICFWQTYEVMKLCATNKKLKKNLSMVEETIFFIAKIARTENSFKKHYDLG